MWWLVILVIVVILVLGSMLVFFKDIRRYLRMRSM
jgi:hypothetical protein